MSNHFDTPILTEEFIHDFLLKLSNEVYDFRKEQPDYAIFLEKRNAWNNTLKRLGSLTIEQYDNEVLQAFLNYQEHLENYSIAKGIVDTIRHQSAACGTADIPGLDKAEAQLAQVCHRFLHQLNKEVVPQCSAFLKARKEIIDTGRSFCRQCGVELAEQLLSHTDR